MSQFEPPMSPPLDGGDEKKLDSQINDNKNVSLNLRLCAGEIEYELLQGATRIQQHKVEHLTPPPNTNAPSSIAEPKQASFLPASTRLRNMINKGDRLIICPGVYDGFSARIAMSLPFPALYMTGAGTTASRLGQADLGIAQLHDMKENAEMIANLDPQGPPLIADMDTGFGGGGPIMVARAVQHYISAGVAGYHIEDQIQQKRCGHLAGKEVVDLESYLQRIRAAKAEAVRRNSDIVLIARTDALQSRGYDECVVRMRAARDLGADVGIIEGFTTKEMAARAVQDLAPWPLLLNSVENGASPIITVQEAQDYGFRLMIFSFASLAPAYTAIKACFMKILTEGVTGTANDLTPKKMFEVCGLADSMKIDEEAGGTSFLKGV